MPRTFGGRFGWRYAVIVTVVLLLWYKVLHGGSLNLLGLLVAAVICWVLTMVWLFLIDLLHFKRTGVVR
jgi:hypothetical protein